MTGTPASALRIRRGRPADAAAILDLESSFPTDRMSARSVRRFLSSPGARVLVAEADRAVVGALILLLRSNSGWGRIYSVVVHPERRGLGLGRRLVEAAGRQARRAGRVGISLEVRSDNGPARSLYRSLGYADHEPLPDYYEDGAPGVRLRKPFGRKVRNYR